jgi:iron-sulfur cluster insertion protein
MSHPIATESANEPLIFTDAAAKKVQQLINEEQNPKLNLRVYITGGGCSGFQYGFTFDENINADDTVVAKSLDPAEETESGEGGSGSTSSTIRLLVDPLSIQYLEGAEIDYEEGIAGARFVIRNPNAKTTCGCGSSFAA